MTRGIANAMVTGALVAAAATPTASTAAGTVSVQRLSNELTLTRWAHPLMRSRVRVAPAPQAHTITRLHYDTEDGLSEVYVALSAFTDPAGRHWVKIRLPMRPNGRRGWVRREALGNYHRVTTSLLVDRDRMRATLRRSGHVIWSAPIGVGKPSTPTPRGNFYVRERLHPVNSGTLYGPLAFGTSAYARVSDWPGGGVVGLHGTNEPKLIPGRPSHGCVRLRLDAITRLGKLMGVGTPVRIT